MKVLVDMNLPPHFAVLLTELGIESVHWSSVGAGSAPDEELFLYARNNGYILLTCDLDFSVLLAHTHNWKPSVVQIRLQALSLNRDVPIVYAALLQNEIDLARGAIMTIDTKKTRVRLLPLSN
jgi:predicted nuclease of predicted toxin-antitoxin system